jgi:hypothetical protein
VLQVQSTVDLGQETGENRDMIAENLLQHENVTRKFKWLMYRPSTPTILHASNFFSGAEFT